MEDLKRLVRIISERKQRQYPLLELKSINENSTKENIFYRYIKKGTVNSDAEAAKLIYNSKRDDDRFRMLKSRLKQKLLNHMFFLDFIENNQKVTTQYEQECIQQLHQAKMLLFTGETRTAKSLVLKVLTTSERLEFTKYIISSLEDLVKIYSDSCQPHLFDEVIDNLNKSRALYKKEEEARDHYYYMKMMIVKSVNSRKKNLEKASKSIKILEKLWKETKSFNIFEYLYKFILLQKELTGDFQGIITLLREIEGGKYGGYPLNKYRMKKSQIVLSMAFAYFRAWDFEKGKLYIENNFEHFEESQSDWYTIYETYFLLLVYSKNYKLALEIIDQIFDNKTFDKLLDNNKGKWKLFNAYVHMISFGNFYTRNFNSLNILEKIPTYNKENEGFNFAVIILQFLYFVEQNKLDELIKRRDEMKLYMANHFKENFSYRTRTIYKLLNIVVENKLDLKKIQFKCRYLVKKLNNNKIVGNAYVELEIVPYEHLWDLIIKMLKYHDARSF